jgi:hypothetical protein
MADTVLKVALCHRTHVLKTHLAVKGSMDYERQSKRFSIGAAILLLSLGPFDTNFSQEKNQLIKPCMAETTPKKNEEATNTTKKKGRMRQKTKDGKKDRNEQEQSKNSNCN